MQILEPQQFATWNEPIEMLYACHSKVKRFCRQLSILPDYLEKHGYTQAVLNDVEQILSYFNRAAPLHHDDEELDFFPQLVKVAPQTQSTIDELEQQHKNLHKNWNALSAQLEELISEQRQNIDEHLIERFVQGYERHITLEEPLFEMGREFLADDVLSEMGKNMSIRRQVTE
ncbi:TPA: hemerythrin domain-containing protein [Haemophilus influenzae]|uniref:hemerythrin domain-containing protein n=1 Tax=Haemophilus influenzae TaxID=727 RepID=UPI000E34D4F4|nr:hemerythrin domain-containing protein [Haemophilus influenzae]RFN84022.1 hemerythrin domain-containing protein [Haemophilus influenzae]